MAVTDPPAEVSTTGTLPAVWGGVTTVTEVSLMLSIIDPATPPNVTEVVSVRPDPVMVTTVPPTVGPLAGVNVVMAGGATKVNCCVDTTSPPGSATVTKKPPAPWDGVTAVISVGLTT